MVPQVHPTVAHVVRVIAMGAANIQNGRALGESLRFGNVSIVSSHRTAIRAKPARKRHLSCAPRFGKEAPSFGSMPDPPEAGTVRSSLLALPHTRSPSSCGQRRCVTSGQP